MSLKAIRDLVEAAENAGWDTCPENAPLLDAARDAYCRLAGIASGDEIGPVCRKPFMERRHAA